MLEDDVLTEDEKGLIDKTFLKMFKAKDYAGALEYFNKLNETAKRYVREHHEYSWHLLVAQGAPKQKV